MGLQIWGVKLGKMIKNEVNYEHTDQEYVPKNTTINALELYKMS